MLEKGSVGEILVDVRSDSDVQIVRKTYLVAGPSGAILMVAAVEQRHLAMRVIRGIANVLQLFSEWVRSSSYSGDPLVQVTSRRGP